MAAPATPASPLKTDEALTDDAPAASATPNSASARELSKALADIVKQADSLTASNKHCEARELLLAQLADYSDEVEVVRSVCCDCMVCGLGAVAR